VHFFDRIICFLSFAATQGHFLICQASAVSRVLFTTTCWDRVQVAKKTDEDMEKGRSEKNAAVISALDNLQNYAAKYQGRNMDKTEEEKKKEEMLVKENVKKATKMTIQEQIAETLRLAKEKEAEKNRIQTEIKQNKEENAKIIFTIQEFEVSECLKMSNWDKDIIEFYEEDLRMEILTKETQEIIEREEKWRKEKQQLLEMAREKERENQRLVEEAKLKAEQEMKAKIMEELRKMTQLQENHSLKIKEEEGKKRNEREVAIQKENEEIRISQLRDEDERKQKEFLKIQKVSEEAKKMNQEAAIKAIDIEEKNQQRKQEQKRIEKERPDENVQLIEEPPKRGDEIKLMLEEDRKIASAILDKRKLEEEEFCSMKLEAEKRRAEELEQQRKKDHKIKIEQLSLNKPQNAHDKTDNLERPKKEFN